jgi:beta-fructofuranosidase
VTAAGAEPPGGQVMRGGGDHLSPSWVPPHASGDEIAPTEDHNLATMLRLPNDWVWDGWIADAGALYHVFFLKAPRALDDPALRHTAATIGHATSPNPTEWELRQHALLPAAKRWDDLALWTGSVARGDDGVWRLYHTALSSMPGYGIRDQRIGMAESEDLSSWRRVGDRPLLDADASWYQTLEEDSRASETWRDPFVLQDPCGDGSHMLITARAKDAPRRRDGMLAHARSGDMVTWELQPPLTDPASLGHLEVPQVPKVDGQWLLAFTCHPEEKCPEQIARCRLFSTWYVLGESPTGPWNIADARPFEDEPSLFAAPLVRQRDGTWAFASFRNQEPEGFFPFEILDPIPVTLRDGRLRRAG